MGLTLQQLIERVFLSHHGESAEVERLFSELPLIAAALFAVRLLIIYSGLREERQRGSKDVTTGGAGWIGIVQGLCLPFRGFSRSGATISTGLLLGIDKRRAEEFSFALAAVLTPVIIAKELIRLIKSQDETSHFLALLQPGLFGMCLHLMRFSSFISLEMWSFNDIVLRLIFFWNHDSGSLPYCTTEMSKSS